MHADRRRAVGPTSTGVGAPNRVLRRRVWSRAEMMSPNQRRMTALPPVGGPVRSVAESAVDLFDAANELREQCLDADM
jgi:hypothetical protein